MQEAGPIVALFAVALGLAYLLARRLWIRRRKSR